jgi:hypothetical protein
MRILYATDGSEGALAGARLFTQLPIEEGCHLTLLTVVPDETGCLSLCERTGVNGPETGEYSLQGERMPWTTCGRCASRRR